MIRREKSPVPVDGGNEESESSEEMSKQSEGYSGLFDAPPELQKTSYNTDEQQDGDSDESVSQQKQQKQQTVESPKAAEVPLIPAVAEASCLSTDTLPLQPREVTGTIERQQIAELKEQETANGDQTTSGNVCCVTAGKELPCESMHGLSPAQTQRIEELKERDNQCSSQHTDVTNPVDSAISLEVGTPYESVDKTSPYVHTTPPGDDTTPTPHPVELNTQQEFTNADSETTPKENLHEGRSDIQIRREKSPVPVDGGNEESESSEEMSKQSEGYSGLFDAPPELQKTSYNTDEQQDSDSDESVSQQKQQKQQTVESPKAAEVPLIPAVAEASCLSTDTLPLQPREVTGPIERQQIAELKEQETANGDQTTSGNVCCVTAGKELPCESMHGLSPAQTQRIEELKERDNQCSSQHTDVTNPVDSAISLEVGTPYESVDKTSPYDHTTPPGDDTTPTPHPVELNTQQEFTNADSETTPKENLHEGRSDIQIRREKSPVPVDGGNEESESSEEMSKQSEGYSGLFDAPPELQKTSYNTDEQQDSDSDESVSQQKQQKQQTVESPKAAEVPLIPAVAEASCLSTDTLPLQPREVTGTIERQQIAELKEQETANGDQTTSGNVCCVTAGKELPCESMHGLSPAQTQRIEELKERDNQCSSQHTDVTNPVDSAISLEVGTPYESVDKTSPYDHTTPPGDDTTPTPHPVELNTQQEFTNADSETTPKKNLHEGRSYISTQKPPALWKYNDMLVDLNTMITEQKDLDTMKYMFRSDPFGKRVIGQMTEAMHLFIKMEEYEFLNANDITYLQAILRKLNRPELIERTIDYCLSTAKVLHFRKPQNDKVNGYTYAKFHLFLDKEYTRDDLAKLKMTVADILGVDLKDIVIVGVEPCNSLLVILMLPDMYIDILVKYLYKNLLQDRFAELGIDAITIGEKQVFKIEVEKDTNTRGSDNQLVSLYHQLASRDRQIEGLEDKCSRLEQELEMTKKQDVIEHAQSLESEKVNLQVRVVPCESLDRFKSKLQKILESNKEDDTVQQINLRTHTSNKNRRQRDGKVFYSQECNVANLGRLYSFSNNGPPKVRSKSH